MTTKLEAKIEKNVKCNENKKAKWSAADVWVSSEQFCSNNKFNVIKNYADRKIKFWRKRNLKENLQNIYKKNLVENHQKKDSSNEYLGSILENF